MPNFSPAELARLNVLLKEGISLIQQDMAIRLTFAGVRKADIASDLGLPRTTVNRMIRGLTRAQKARAL